MSGWREGFLAEARKLLGTPWRHRGRSARGVDCVGLLLLAGWNSGADFDAPWPRGPTCARFSFFLSPQVNISTLEYKLAIICTHV